MKHHITASTNNATNHITVYIDDTPTSHGSLYMQNIHITYKFINIRHPHHITASTNITLHNSLCIQHTHIT